MTQVTKHLFDCFSIFASTSLNYLYQLTLTHFFQHLQSITITVVTVIH